MMGGAFAVCPAYQTDLFGVKNLASNHGRMLLSITGGFFVGPFILMKSHSYATFHEISILSEHISNLTFEEHFGQNKD